MKPDQSSRKQPSLFRPTGLAHESILFGACEPSVTAENATASMIGIPVDQGASYRRGAKHSPNEIRLATSSKNMTPFSENGVDVTTRHSVYDWGNLRTHSAGSNVFEQIKNGVNQAAQHTSLLLVLGGDHSITFPCIAGLHDLDPSPFGLVYFDAHTDYYSILNGTPNSHASTIYRLIDSGMVNPEKMVIIGERAGPPDHVSILNKLGALIVTTNDVFEHPSRAIIQALQEKLVGCQQVYVSIDLDVFDLAYAPAVSTPEPAGLTPRQVLKLFEGLASLPVRAFDLVELIPSLDHAGITGSLGAKLIKELLALLPPSSGTPA